MQHSSLNPARGVGGIAAGYRPLAASSSQYASDTVEIPVAPVPKPKSGPSKLLASGIQEYSSRASSTAIQDGFAKHAPLTRVPAEQRPAVQARRRADDARIQQLRGIFAAYDQDSDGLLSADQLALALLALGLQPTEAVLDRFLAASKAAQQHLSYRPPTTRSGDSDASKPPSPVGSDRHSSSQPILVDLPTVSLVLRACDKP